MNFNEAFKILLQENSIENNDVLNQLKAINKKLNSIFYNSSSEFEHMVLAGSFGRGTAIDSSDIDYCFVLPNIVYKQYENRKGNIQSQLLSEIRLKLQERYPNSEIKGDGQVVDLKFKKRIVELVPAFNLNNNDFLIYPDTHFEGTWKTTSPIKQHTFVEDTTKKYFVYKDLCKILRLWRDTNNIEIKGIIIDSITYSFLNSNFTYLNKNIDSVDIIELLKKLFNYISEYPNNKIKILGELEEIDYNGNFFRKKAKKASLLLNEDDMLNLWDNCISLFGQGFPENPCYRNRNKTEQFINQLFPTHIKNNLKIDCKITSDGFLPVFLSKILNLNGKSYIIERNKKLTFFITFCDVQEPYDVYWKVRNVGPEADKRNCIRGQIIKGKNKIEENSDFHGPHFVECFIVKSGVCVAKTRIFVPIQ